MKVEEKYYTLTIKIGNEDIFVLNDIQSPDSPEFTDNIGMAVKCVNEITAKILKEDLEEDAARNGCLYDFDIIPMKITYEY